MAIYNNKIYQNILIQAAKSDLPWEKLTGKKIFISGATGLFGLFLTDLLMYKNKEDALNCHVTAVSRNEEKARKRFDPAYFESDCFTYLAHDISVPFDTG
ncbi:MAG: SDR family NAD-dependent epimerase/dehydratase, partial [Lachnospiraceae bacterium]|nr:SDR family NAD-dependent epimerase/dehydratase [Lachnospiraceae bacterium]